MSFRPSIFVIVVLFVFLTSSGSAESAAAPGSYTISRRVNSPESVEPTNQKQGWTSQPDGRGTLDILWSCGFTMFLCSWSVLCMNVPGPDDSPFKVFRRKVYLTTLAFLGPEFIFQIALGQWASACRSVKDFHASGYTQWTMNHAFFADMGGFVLHTRDWTPFPIDAKQLHYLVTEGYVVFPTVDKRKIADKNKVDGLLRIITLCQILWFVVNMAGRAAQHLAITCFELTAAAFIVCSIGTAFCWAHKPADVLTSEAIETESSIAEILVNAGDRACKPYSRTPLDFVSRKEWAWSLYWSNWINILRNMGIVFGPNIRPVDRFENTISLELTGGLFFVFLAATAAYSAIFLCGWNYSFPTSTEQILWRAAGVTMMGTLIAYWIITEFAYSIYPTIRWRFFGQTTTVAEKRDVENNNPRIRQWSGYGRFVRKAKSVAACIRNNSVSKDPALDVPLKAILPIYVVGVFYCHARTYIFVADIIELRALPGSAYATVKWSNIIPHL